MKLTAVESRHHNYISRWKSGLEDGMRGKEGLSRHIRRYMFEKHNHACVLCGWNKINPSTGKSPLEVDHIDGNHRNNAESNLRLLCPNCHSLTPTFKALNTGYGRSQRYSN